MLIPQMKSLILDKARGHMPAPTETGSPVLYHPQLTGLSGEESNDNNPALYSGSLPGFPEFGRLILRDGSTATVRVATIDDATLMADFFHRLSPESRQRRFFSFSEPAVEFVRSLCDSSNPHKQLTLLVSVAQVFQKVSWQRAVTFDATTRRRKWRWPSRTHSG